jgi:hypothetical protein|tara:strand:+ start:56 stop:292 length:237 start_codon:yes stop_codon:yes gene_type:complete
MQKDIKVGQRVYVVDGVDGSLLRDGLEGLVGKVIAEGEEGEVEVEFDDKSMCREFIQTEFLIQIVDLSEEELRLLGVE